jgi:hypothetical protein
MQHTRGGARGRSVDVWKDPCLPGVWVIGVLVPVCVYSGGAGQDEGAICVHNIR